MKIIPTISEQKKASISKTIDAETPITSTTLTNPTGVATGPDSADGSVVSDFLGENSYLYWAVRFGETPLTAAEIIGSSGNGAYYGLYLPSYTGLLEVSVPNSLDPNTEYAFDFVYISDEGGTSEVASSPMFTTEPSVYNKLNALSFDGTNDQRVDINTDVVLASGTDFTFHADVRPKAGSSGQETIIGKSGVNNRNCILIWYDSDPHQIRVYSADGTLITFDSPENFELEQDYSIIFSRDSFDNATVYVEGVQSPDTKTVAGDLTFNRVGINNAVSEMHGVMNDVGIWDAVLNSLQDAVDIASGQNPEEVLGDADLIYRFDESGSDNVAVNGGTLGASYNGTLQNFSFSPSPWVLYGIDASPPVATFSPESGATDIAVDSTITITLDEASRNTDASEITNANVASILGLKETNDSGADIAFTATINTEKTEIEIIPDSDLPNDQLVYVELGSIEDANGNESVTQSSTFTTIIADVIAPVATMNPENGLTKISKEHIMSIYYPEVVYNIGGGAITDANVASLLTLKEDNALGADFSFSASVKHEAGYTYIKIIGDSNFLNAQDYYLAIAPVQDSLGNASSTQNSFFTTEPVRTGTLGSTDPRATNYNALADISDNSETYTSITAGECDHILETGNFQVDNDSLNLPAGSIIGIRGGARGALRIANFTGTPTQPYLFINLDSQSVITQTNGTAIEISNCEHVRLTGTGVSGEMYGFNVVQATQSGIRPHERSSDVEIDHIEVGNVTAGPGIWYVNRPQCDFTVNRGSFIQYNTLIHHTNIHDVHGEGIYCGGSKWDGTFPEEAGCPGVDMYQVDLVNTLIYNNIADRCGWDALQVGGGIANTQFYNNDVNDYGTSNTPGQNIGIIANPGTRGSIWGNRINGGTGTGIQLQGFDLLVYSNLIKNAGEDAIRMGDNSPYANMSYRIHNNTIVNSGAYAVFNNSSLSVSNIVSNNLFIDCTNDVNSTGNTTATNNLSQSTSTDYDTPVYDDTAHNAAYADPENDDYTPASGTAPVNAGIAVADTMIIDALARARFNGTVDIGAFEYAA